VRHRWRHRGCDLGTLAALVLLVAAPGAVGQSFNYMTPAELKQRLESGTPPFLLDIQVEKEYAQHHLPGTFPTYAYPARSDEEREKLKPAVGKILAGRQDVVIICPAGGQGAKNAYSFLREQGVPESRMRILEKGQRGWPYPEMLSAPK
jgi:rhodanese-related sulfurtransferase